MSAANATREVAGDAALAILAVRGVAAVVVFITAQADSNHADQLLFGSFRILGIEISEGLVVELRDCVLLLTER